MIEDKNRTVAELLETAKAKLRSLIQYLCALDATQSKDGVFFASNAMEGSSQKVCAVLSMRNEILECELPQNYAWDFTPWEELMGYGLAETKLTKDHANTVLAQILYDMTFFGMDYETWKREAAEVEESLEVSRKAAEAGEYRTAEEVFSEFGLPKDEPDEQQPHPCEDGVQSALPETGGRQSTPAFGERVDADSCQKPVALV